MLAETSSSAGSVYGHPQNRDVNTIPIDGLIPIFFCGNISHVLTGRMRTHHGLKLQAQVAEV